MSAAFVLGSLMLPLMVGAMGACGGTPPEQLDPFSARTDDDLGVSTGALVVATEKSLPGDGDKPIELAAAVDGGVDGGVIDVGVPDAPLGETGPTDVGTVIDTGKPPIDTSPSFDSGEVGTGASGPSGFWRFDDCSPTSNFLADSSGNGAFATHALGRTCKPGISGQAVSFASTKDIVQVADQPQFTLGVRVAVGAWINPTKVTGTHPVVLKRLGTKTALSLTVKDGNIEFSVVLASGVTVLSRAPVAKNVWTHVAGLYDGRFLFLFVNGEQVGQVLQVGTIKNVFAPIRIGSTTESQHFEGLIDEVWLSTNVVSKAEVMALSCIAAPPTLAVTPIAGGPVPADTPVHYSVALTNKDIGACPNSAYFLSTDTFGPGNTGITANVFPGFVPDVPPGGVASFGIDVSGREDSDPGVHTIPFNVTNFSRFESTPGALSFELSAPTGCRVPNARELMITSTSVVDDPARTAPGGVWTFGRLMRDLAPTPEAATAMTRQLFDSWLTNQTVNGFTIPARPTINGAFLDGWPRTVNGELDLDRSPLRLLAIVNRVDVRDLAKGNAGEGRFVFGVLGPGGFPQQFTVILEYKLPAKTEADVLAWANDWHALGALPFPSAAYNAALEALTLRFSGRGVAPGNPNGSSLGQLRTNENALDKRWELREFTLSPTTGFLQPSPILLTPDLSFNGTSTLAQFINDNETAILAEKHDVPLLFNGSPFLTGSVFNDLIAWTAPGIRNNEARHKLSLNTCNGCHASAETNTAFLHVSPRFPGSEAALSPFLVGTTAFDPVTGAPRPLNDLARRNADLKFLVCAAPPSPKSLTTSSGTAPTPKTSIAKGIGRVH
ncbi:MAG: LamG domain-containing protein [Polyangiales bacterium]